MKNIVGCLILLKDDFNNILLIQKGKKKNPGKWQLVGRRKKGKETDDKCINNAIKEDLNTLIFDLEEYGEFNDENNETFMIYTGKIKDFMNLGKNVISSEWVSENRIENIDIEEFSKNVVNDFFKKL